MQAVVSNDLFQSPIVQRRTLTMLRLCQKIIMQEFGAKLRLNQEDLMEQLKHYAKLSHNRNFHQLMEMLEKELA